MADRDDLTINDILNGIPVGVKNGVRAQAIRDGFASQNQDLLDAIAGALGALIIANNLSDVADVPTSRANLDVVQRLSAVVVGDLVTQTASGELAGAGVRVDDTGTTTAELLTAAEIDVRLEEERRYAFMLSGK
ncbi:hypothetical protein LCGC14_0164880 [marine sediment metagenome]|uniref:Uncharacterized protein n=1 Tax=marine sediment metagenome TaxID=412755 RepID=A0A0F9UYP8_9ZZZZ